MTLNQDQLTKNILNIYGAKGKAWLMELPIIIKSLSDHWHLTDLQPFKNLTYHYVAKGLREKNFPVVLKIGLDQTSITREIAALNYFAGNASVKLLDCHMPHLSLLIASAEPGITLKTYYPENVERVMDSYIATMKKLHAKLLPVKHNYSHINDWLISIDNIGAGQIDTHIFHKAIYLKNELLATLSTSIFLHGDLHLDNILKDGNSWVAIDPKGIVGDAEFEMAAFDIISRSELENISDIQPIFVARINKLAEKANLDKTRLKKWIFIRLVLSAAWSIEDNDDPSWALNLAKIISVTN